MIHIDEGLLKEFRDMPCEWCRRPPPSDPHHLMKRGVGGGNRMDIRINLVSLCRFCHVRAEGGDILEESLHSLVFLREIWRLQRMPKEEHERFAKIMADLNQLMRDYP